MLITPTERPHFLALRNRGGRGTHGARARPAYSLDQYGSHPHVFYGAFQSNLNSPPCIRICLYIQHPQAFTHALFDLTTYPEHFLPMREEVERVVKEEGWTKAALNSMFKVDSFLRESQRLKGNGPGTYQPTNPSSIIYRVLTRL